MFGLMTRLARRPQLPRPSRIAPRSRLSLQRLEVRDCPSVGLSTGVEDGGGGGGAPSISFSYTQGASRTVNIQGSVTDDSPGNLTVTFSGGVEGTATTNRDGSFSTTLTANALGTFQAQVVDGNGNLSNVYQVTLTNSTPTLTLSHQQNFSGWVLSGSVGDEYAPGLTVNFYSSIPQINGQKATVADANNYYFAFNIPAGTSGTVSATVTDWWGSTSAVANDFIG